MSFLRRLLFPATICTVVYLPFACQPDIVERRTYPKCLRAYFGGVKRVYNRETGEPEYVQRAPTDSTVFETICGLGGHGDTAWKIRQTAESRGKDGRLIARDTPIPGKSVTLDCYDELPSAPDAPMWRSAVWFRAPTGTYCRVPKGARG